MKDKTLKQDISYGIDSASPDGDYTGISIRIGSKAFIFIGEEAEAIIALIELVS